MHNIQTPVQRSVVTVNGGTSDPSSSRLLADRIASKVTEISAQQQVAVTITNIELRPLAQDIAAALTSGLLSPALQQAAETLHNADGIVASTPIYQADASGLFTSFFQVLDNDLLIGTPTVLAATGGSSRHALALDQQIRGNFAYLRTLTMPTSVFAAPEDWQGGSLAGRIERAAAELSLMLAADFVGKLRNESWQHYQHELGSAGGSELGISIDSDLMRLAAGGK